MSEPRLIDPTELVSATDIAALFGVTSPAVSNWKKRHADFPSPVITVAGGDTDLWLRPEVIRWWVHRHPGSVQVLRHHAEEIIKLLDAENE